MVIAALILGVFILLSTGVLSYTFLKMDDNYDMYHITLDSLVDLVNKLNKELPGSNIKIEKGHKTIKIVGEIKFLKNRN